MTTIDLTKAKTEFVNSMLGLVTEGLGSVANLCAEIDPSPGGLGETAAAAFSTVKDLRAKVQAKITSYELDT